MPVTSATRCPCCDARAFAPSQRMLVFPDGFERRFGFACESCGLLVDDPGAVDDHRLSLAALLGGASARCDPASLIGLDLFTLRIAASARDLVAEPADADQEAGLREPHSPLAAAARLRPLARVAPAPVSLAVLCREEEAEALAVEIAAHASWCDDVLLLVDRAERAEASQGTVRVASHPHGGDFAAQRNRVQALCRHSWVLQLDSDEMIDAAFADRLGALAATADAAGTVSVGFPRRNLVDGALSDLFPDTQYRLNRREIPYIGRVHERPNRPWQRSTIAAGPAIAHRLTAEHVARRSAIYEAMAPGEGRVFERDALLRPYRP
ncbi:hypothetical protein [Aureimonas pseudogalii]|uniref:Glycosyltransferase 2-like domain-containing protein n=1 Tax=Aureimonas pseudogalii TaxID=1744844 RepID=A0A7W6H6C7_9HYPH|nr:hypothetical protein [Aureimonas pseudogalii]MBB3999378.1 hypothetical protein [Aureimonas pseudogalii]